MVFTILSMSNQLFDYLINSFEQVVLHYARNYFENITVMFTKYVHIIILRLFFARYNFAYWSIFSFENKKAPKFLSVRN